MSTAAHTTGRDIAKRLVLALLVASATLGATPPPSPGPPPGYVLIPAAPDPSQMGYYMMQGSRIVSGVYPSAPACMKALAALMKTLPGNVAPIVCAHRVP